MQNEMHELGRKTYKMISSNRTNHKQTTAAHHTQPNKTANQQYAKVRGKPQLHLTIV